MAELADETTELQAEQNEPAGVTPETTDDEPAAEPTVGGAGIGEGDIDGAGDPDPRTSADAKLTFQCRNCGTWNDLMRPDITTIAPPKSEHFRTCPECEGIGKVDTGSFVPGKETTVCPTCRGEGYTSPDQAPPAVPQLPSDQPPWPNATWNEDQKRWE